MLDNCAQALSLLDIHHEAFFNAEILANRTGHPVPMDTRGWSQILVSVLSGVNGVARKKGADLLDGSDVKGANTWSAIDTPRFNGVIKSGTQASHSGKIESLDNMPNIYLVLWDETVRKSHRCRIWTVRPRVDVLFRELCNSWYNKKASKEISSDNFQLHPPRGLDNNVIRNSLGNLNYPLFFCAEKISGENYKLVSYNSDALTIESCTAC